MYLQERDRTVNLRSSVPYYSVIRWEDKGEDKDAVSRAVSEDSSLRVPVQRFFIHP